MDKGLSVKGVVDETFTASLMPYFISATHDDGDGVAKFESEWAQMRGMVEIKGSGWAQ